MLGAIGRALMMSFAMTLGNFGALILAIHQNKELCACSTARFTQGCAAEIQHRTDWMCERGRHWQRLSGF